MIIGLSGIMEALKAWLWIVCGNCSATLGRNDDPHRSAPQLQHPELKSGDKPSEDIPFFYDSSPTDDLICATMKIWILQAPDCYVASRIVALT